MTADNPTSGLQSEIVKLEALIDILSPLADTLDPPEVCWIGNGGDEADDYCPTCCRAFVDTSNFMMARDVDDAWIVDGGWDASRENDGSSACCRCGCTLGYSLTPAGMYAEIAHFADVISDGFAQPLRHEDAYAVRAVLCAAAWSDDAEAVSAVLAIGEAAAAALREVEVTTPARGSDV